jgi:ABC-type transport system involved in multi-copper enzyme maturation permease subunit/ABC-type uncharacterized transport system involved in gliding motility auxiliary subunit
MKNIITIAKRELRTYFDSPIGYIFAIVFLLVLTSLFISGFFIYPRAEMRGFFNHLPIVLCIFIPAVSMRLWAEDRKENTWEMLLTLPMKGWELTLGKFSAALVFYCIALAGTLTIPVMLGSLGSPDFGPIIGAYIGSVLLGAIFLAMGIFFSALVADQIVAFVLSLMASFTLFLLGTDLISAVIDSSWDGLGSFLAKVLGVTRHFNSFAKGVIELGDILYFAVWIIVFLFLNTLYIEGRMREGYKKHFAVMVAMCVAIGLTFNWITADTTLFRLDLTEDRIYTVSNATKRVLTSLDTPVQITLYITPKDKMPTQMREMEEDILDKLQEIDLASGGYIDYKAMHMEASNALAAMRDEEDGTEEKDEKDNLIEKRMLDKGVKPFNIQALEADQVINKLIYSSIGIAYKDRPEEFIPQVIPQSLDDLEYNLMNIVYKISREHKPSIALVAPKQDIKINPQIAMLYRQMGREVPRSEDPYEYLEKFLEIEKYATHRVKISQREHLPEEYDTIVVVNPEGFTERQKWEVSRALHEGKNVIIAVQNEEWNYQLQRNTIAITKKEINPEINDLLSEYGIEVISDSLMDIAHQPLTVMDRSNPFAQLTGQGLTLDLPTQIVVNPETMNKDVPVTAKLSQIGYMWGSALKADEKKLKELGLKKTVLISSSNDSWTTKTSPQLMDEDVRTPEERARQGSKAGMKVGPFPLAILIEGQFPAGLSGKSRPEYRNEPVDPQMAQFSPPTPVDAPVTEAKPAPGKLIVIGCSTLFRKEFMNEGGRDFFINAVDSLTLSNDLVEIRGKKRIDRAFAQPTNHVRAMWKFIVLALIPLIFAFWGIYGGITRQRSRDIYTMKFS